MRAVVFSRSLCNRSQRECPVRRMEDVLRTVLDKYSPVQYNWVLYAHVSTVLRTVQATEHAVCPSYLI